MPKKKRAFVLLEEIKRRTYVRKNFSGVAESRRFPFHFRRGAN